MDLISIETMFSLEEALAALRAIRGVTDLPIFVCLSFDLKPKGFFTLMGETPRACVKALEENGADVLGSNCQLGSREMVDLIQEDEGVDECPHYRTAKCWLTRCQGRRNCL